MRPASHHTLLLLVLLGSCACSGGSGAPPEAARVRDAAPRDVRTVIARQDVWEVTLQVTGELQAFEAATLAAEVPGRLERLSVDLGSRVKAGQEIAAVETDDYELRVAQAQAALQAARARLALASDDHEVDPERVAVVREARAELNDATRQAERLSSLSADNVVTQSAVDTAQARRNIAESRLWAALEDVAGRRALLEQRRAELDLALAQLSDARIVAPFDGAIAARLASPGDYLGIGEPIARLVRFDPLRLRLQIPERSVYSIRLGQPARVELEGSERAIIATITRLSPELDPVNRTLMIELELANRDGFLRPGSFARASIVVDAEAMTLVVPRAALVRFAGIDKLFVVEDGMALERPITVGRTDAERIEVLQGISDGDRIVLSPGGLTSGAAVRVEG